jgi:hypothetical protein
MNRSGFFALILGAALLYVFFHFMFGIDALAYLATLLGKLLIIVKSLLFKMLLLVKTQIALLTWEIILAFVITFSKRATVKFLFIQIPMTLLMPILLTFALSPHRKRRLKRRFVVYKEKVLRGYTSTRIMFERFFGGHAWIALAFSLLFALGSFGFFFYFFGISFFLWLGKWGPIGTFFSWVWSWITYFLGFLRGAMYRLPMLGAIMGFFATFWKDKCVPMIPHLEWWRKRKVRQALRHARSSRQHSAGVYRRFIRRRHKRRERKRLNRIEQIMWLPDSKPYWNRQGVRFNDSDSLTNRAAHCSVENLYYRAALGGVPIGVIL